MGGFIGAIFIIATLVIAGLICKKINQNTIGTTGAYVKRYIIVWFITAVIMFGIFSAIF